VFGGVAACTVRIPPLVRDRFGGCGIAENFRELSPDVCGFGPDGPSNGLAAVDDLADQLGSGPSNFPTGRRHDLVHRRSNACDNLRRRLAAADGGHFARRRDRTPINRPSADSRAPLASASKESSKAPLFK